MLSMGGTSIWFTSLAIGIVLSVSRQVRKKRKKEERSLQRHKIKAIISGGEQATYISRHCIADELKK